MRAKLSDPKKGKEMEYSKKPSPEPVSFSLRLTRRSSCSQCVTRTLINDITASTTQLHPCLLSLAPDGVVAAAAAGTLTAVRSFRSLNDHFAFNLPSFYTCDIYLQSLMHRECTTPSYSGSSFSLFFPCLTLLIALYLQQVWCSSL